MRTLRVSANGQSEMLYQKNLGALPLTISTVVRPNSLVTLSALLPTLPISFFDFPRCLRQLRDIPEPESYTRLRDGFTWKDFMTALR